MDEANLNMDDADDDGTFVPTGGRQPQALLLSSLDSMCAQFALRTVCTMGLRFNLRTNINDILTVCAPELIWPVTVIQRLQRFLSARCADMPGWRAVGKLDLPTFMDRHGQWSSAFDESSLFYYLDEYVKHHAKDMFTVFGASCDALGERLASERVLLVGNIDMLARVLGLPPHERALLLFASLVKYKRDLRAVMVDCKVAHSQEAFQLLASLAGASTAEVAASLRPGSRLETLGLIEPPLPENSVTDLGDLMRISDRLLHVLLGDYACEADMMAVFTRPAPSTTLSQSDYPHVETDARYLTALLENASQQRAAGVNILLYGAPGTGKTELARVLARDAGCELYEVDCLDKDGNSLTGKDRYRSLQVSQAFLRGRPGAVLLFDEVEDVFPGPTRELMSLFGHEEPRGSVNGKAWVNQTLEQNPVPVIWVSNSIRQIDPAYLRRFQFHLELKVPPPTVRESIIRKHLEGLEVSDAFMAKLAARKTLTPAQIDSAARFARLTQPAMEEPAESLIERQLDHADQAMGLRPEVQAHRVVTEYKLDYLNLETRFSVERIIEALRARRRGTLCFYGPPGTGKTVLAEHIAAQLDMPLLIRRASDLMSKYVGETEQQIAAMFSRAEEERALLLLDEADSFMQSRQGAVRNYEVSEVNEMLQGMERFDGIFICTTNLFDRIDEAALRRFAFKIRFKPLVRAQREQMFIAEALGGKAEALKPVWREMLASLDMLTPGDFAVVKQQSVLLGETLEPEAFLAQLRQEHSIKPELRERRSIGFTPR
ncbi:MULTISPECIES: AAA family ATPase [Ralstonia]|jgi:SpoVK/Ycf46/Vps4 family AAA+-type ATPase|uniref:ATP-dependent zinc metalloprotease FtsH n=5 Tax=Bacteria TaxID=2 RepID=A0AAD2BYZ1_9RALS|nr:MULTISPECIES: ATP-binding protein [Ralstonia]MEA3271858.1 ATP-binding protein [Pseudomonadota bacterium]ENZ75859.1 AAA+ family ATPase [Ralstonia pickettii OR214]MBB0027023.1 ATP-binding protein [Ralstonia pickettii]MBB0034562.1 ATP-binding protein [Ralstonia pickettii]MBB0100103.1 ATP-binding protein [Ralstonia pickettii]